MRKGAASALLFGTVIALLPHAALSQSAWPEHTVDGLRVKGSGCDAAVDLDVRDKRLSEVLRRLASVMAFDLRFEDPVDPTLSSRLEGSGTRVVQDLLRGHDRYMIVTKPDPRCRLQYRIVQLWLLPAADTQAGRAFARPPPVAAHGTTARNPMPVQGLPLAERRARESAERKAAYDHHVATHGGPPPGEEEDTARP